LKLLQVARNNRFYKKRCPTREAIGQKESANAHENKIQLEKNIQVGPFLVTLALLRRVDRE